MGRKSVIDQIKTSKELLEIKATNPFLMLANFEVCPVVLQSLIKSYGYPGDKSEKFISIDISGKSYISFVDELNEDLDDAPVYHFERDFDKLRPYFTHQRDQYRKLFFLDREKREEILNSMSFLDGNMFVQWIIHQNRDAFITLEAKGYFERMCECDYCSKIFFPKVKRKSSKSFCCSEFCRKKRSNGIRYKNDLEKINNYRNLTSRTG